MPWWKKGTFYMLSSLFLVTFSCSQLQEEHLQKKKKKSKINLVSDKVSDFFNLIQDVWTLKNIQRIDSVGRKIVKQDSTLNFYPYTNDYENHAFIFSTQNRKDFEAFIQEGFLTENASYTNHSYTVWRRKIEKDLCLDISIEPHPTLNWILVVRQRN